jgi:hypothetical protein
MWLTPITDRTLEDVIYAQSKVKEWIAAYSRGETPIPAVTIEGYESSWGRLSSHLWGDMSDKHWGDLAPTVPPDLKGCVNASDLNRIEDNLNYLNWRIIFKGGFPDSRVVVKTWKRGEVVLAKDVERLLSNAQTVADLYGLSNVVPIPLETIKGYEDMNNLEIMTQLAKEQITARWEQLSSLPWGNMSNTYWDDAISQTSRTPR